MNNVTGGNNVIIQEIYYSDQALLQALACKVENRKICKSSSQFCHFHEDKFKELKDLDLSNSNLSTFPDCLAKLLHKIKLLDLSGNKFKFIPSALHILAHHKQNPTVILSDNSIDFDSVHAKKQLKVLSTAGMDFITDSLIDFAPSDDDSL